VGCGTVSKGKKRRSAEEHCLQLQDGAVEEKWLLFYKIGIICLLYQIQTAYFEIP
jgi:hypothetical protein